MGNAKSRLVALEAWQEHTGTSDEDLGRLFGVSSAQVRNYKNGVTPLSVERVVKLSLMSGIPANELVTDERTARLLKLLGEQISGSRDVTEGKPSVA